MRETFCISLLLVGLYAPVPQPRPAPAVVMPEGATVLVWGGETWRLTLGKGGAYACFRQGEAWTGRWSYDKDARTLHIDDERLDTPGANQTYRWSVRFDDDWRGATVGDWGKVNVMLKVAMPAKGKDL